MTAAKQEMRDFDKWYKSLRNFEWLQDAGVSGAMDLDLFIERRGRFFVAEGKPWTNGVNMGFGQYLALEALAAEESFDVYLVGEPEKGDAVYVLPLGGKPPVKTGTRPVWYPPRRFMRMTKPGLADLIRGWYAEASGR